MAAPDRLLAVEDIHTYYGDSYVLQGVSVAVPRGSIVAILGRNGMGKTTLIRSIAGLSPPRQGTITYAGRVISGLPAYFKKCFAFAWQNMYMPTDDLTGGKRFFDNAVKFKQTQSNDALWARYQQLKQEGGEAYEAAKEKMKPHFAMGAELKKQSVNTKIQGTAAVSVAVSGSTTMKPVSPSISVRFDRS